MIYILFYWNYSFTYLYIFIILFFVLVNVEEKSPHQCAHREGGVGSKTVGMGNGESKLVDLLKPWSVGP
jgi:hypothetical protein